MTHRHRLLASSIARAVSAPLAISLALAAALGHAAGPSSAPPAASQRPPNIVLIVADDLGFSDLGAYGAEFATPHLDALAARHMGKPGYLSVLNDRVVTVSSLLQDAGYRTYAAGKWHVGKEPHNLPDRRGFDRSLVQGDSGSDNWYTAQRYLDLADQVYWFEDGKPANMPKEFYSSRFYADKAIDYLRNDWATTQSTERAPFFLYLAFQANHIPLQAPPEFIERQRGRYDAGWSVLREQRHARTMALGLLPKETPLGRWPGLEDWNTLDPKRRSYETRRMEVYAGMAEAMDYEIGRLREAIRSLGADDNTIFVFLSDNGAEPSDPYEYLSGRLWLATQYTRDTARLGAKGAYATIGRNWVSAAVSPLSTHKFYAGEGGLRVPLIIRAPAAFAVGQQGGQIASSFTHVTDITPTLLEFAGVSHPGKPGGLEPMTGRSLVPLLRDTNSKIRGIDETLGYELAGNAAMFGGDLKLVRNLPPVGDGRWQLFDIARDPGETKDLRSTQAEDFQRLLEAYQRFEIDDGVQALPEGYTPQRQVSFNALRRVILPQLIWPAAITVVLTILWLLLRRRRRPA